MAQENFVKDVPRFVIPLGPVVIDPINCAMASVQMYTYISGVDANQILIRPYSRDILEPKNPT